MNKPLLVYDGECSFCKKWVERVHNLTKDKVEYQPFQVIGKQFPEVSEDEFKRSIQLIMPDGKRYSAAHAAFKTLSYSNGHQLLLWFYEHCPSFAWYAELIYRSVAKRRHCHKLSCPVK